MTPEQKSKIEAKACEVSQGDDRERILFCEGATFGISLANEPVGDDERVSICECGQSDCPIFKTTSKFA